MMFWQIIFGLACYSMGLITGPLVLYMVFNLLLKMVRHKIMR